MNNKCELGVKDLTTYARVVAEVLGGSWITRKIKEDRAESRRLQLASRNRRHEYLYKSQPHPIVAWAIEFERMQKESLESGRLSINESTLKLSSLGRSLQAVQGIPGFGKLVARLKKIDSFFSAAFEAEVAASYVARNYSVKFVEETNDGRTPDLKVTRPDGTHFWVECKCRDERTQRDKNIHSIWIELQQGLLKVLSPGKLNAVVLVKSLQDPNRNDILGLHSFIIDSLKRGGCGSIDIDSGGIASQRDPTGRFDVVVKPLSGPDEEIEGDGFQFRVAEDFEDLLVAMEMRHSEDGRQFYKNPVVLAFKNAIPSDKVTGIIHGLKSAVGQLPRDESCVVWIRVPDNAWNSDLDRSFAEAKLLIQNELQGDKNRRVNAVILITRLFKNLKDGENSGIAYHPLMMTIEHSNPRTQVANAA